MKLTKSQITASTLLLMMLFGTFCPAIIGTLNVARASPNLSDNFSSNSGLWSYYGSASLDTANHDVVLTQAINNQLGAIWLNQPITSGFTASFSYWAGGGTGADGIVMMFYKLEDYSMSSGDYDWGGYLGFNSGDGYNCVPDPGYGIEFDSYQNVQFGDPSGDYIALIQNSVANHLVYVNDNRVDDGHWHNVVVEVTSSSVEVYVDSGLVLSWTGTLDTTYSGFGFTAATGGLNNLQMISNFAISSSSIAGFSAISQIGGSVNIQSSFINGGNPTMVNGGETQSFYGINAAEPISLTANPSAGYQFGSWIVTQGISSSDGSTLDLTSPDLSCTVEPGDCIVASFIQQTNIAPPTGSALSKSGVTFNLESNLIKNSDGSYSFTAQITPIGQTYLLFNDQEISALENNVLNQLGNAGFTSNGNTKFYVMNLPNNVIDKRTFDFIEGFFNVLTLPDDADMYIQAFGTVTGYTMTAAELVNDFYPYLPSIPNPPDIVVDTINQMYTSLQQAIEYNLLRNFPVYIENTQFYPSYMVGQGQELEIAVSGLSPSTQMQSSISLTLSGSNAVIVSTPVGLLQPSDVGMGVGGYEATAGSFSVPMTLSQGWFSSDYNAGTVSVQDPDAQFIQMTSSNLQIDNADYDSSSSTLSINVAIPEDLANQENSISFLVPTEMNPEGSDSYQVTLNGVSVSCSISSVPGIGDSITCSVNENGTLLLYLPVLGASITVSTYNGILFVSGSGFSPESSITLQYYEEGGWEALPGSGTFTTDTDGCFFYQNVTENYFDGIPIVQATDANGNVAVSACSSISDLALNVSSQILVSDSEVTLTAAATGSPLLYRFSADAGGNWTSWDASNVYNFTTEASQGVDYYNFLVEAVDANGLATASDPVIYEANSPVSSITVTPQTTSLTSGCSIPFTATAYDAYGDSWNITSLATWGISSNAGGSWLNNNYTSAKMGSWTVTASYDGVQGTAQLAVCYVIDYYHTGTVSGSDFFYFVDAYINYWSKGTIDPACDLNHDGVINGADFFIFVADYIAYWQSVAEQNG